MRLALHLPMILGDYFKTVILNQDNQWIYLRYIKTLSMNTKPI